MRSCGGFGVVRLPQSLVQRRTALSQVTLEEVREVEDFGLGSQDGDKLDMFFSRYFTTLFVFLPLLYRHLGSPRRSLESRPYDDETQPRRIAKKQNQKVIQRFSEENFRTRSPTSFESSASFRLEDKKGLRRGRRLTNGRSRRALTSELDLVAKR